MFRLCQLLVLLGVGCVSLGCREVPHYTIYHTADHITIDGRLDEPSWAAAESVSAFVFPWWEEGAQEPTEARVLWDVKNLYVSYTVTDTNIRAKHSQRDSRVFEDDCVEIFIAPDPENVENYFNFEMNARGAILDQSPNRTVDRKWNAEGMQVAVRHDGTLNNTRDRDHSWTMEVAIPLAVFGEYPPRLPPEDGDVWRVNLNRIHDDSNRQYSQWSNTAVSGQGPNFHLPPHFGTMQFTTTLVGEMEGAQVRPSSARKKIR